MIGSLVHDTFLQSSCEDPLKACLTRVDCNLDTEKSIEDVNALLDSVPLLSIDRWQPKMIHFPLSSSPFLSIVEPSQLDDFWEHQLISILQEYKEAIGWKITDIKGISASMVMQRIHLEDTAKASQHVFDQEPSQLDDFWEHQLISILQEYKEAIGWKITDIKGISASMVMQRIHLEDTAKASQHVFDQADI
nr:hypothetical protein CFP56_02291 [Quercus suber]